MERLQVNVLRDLIHRLRRGESQRAVARDLGLSRLTVGKYAAQARAAGYLDETTPVPEPSTLATVLGRGSEVPRQPSSVQPHQSVVEALLEQRVELMTIFDRLRQDHGYAGSYSSVRRFVHQLQPPERRVTVRVHSAPGEEAQVDFGAAGQFVDPRTGQARPAHVFVLTLSYSRHQYAELVFDQKIATWIACHRAAFESFGGVPRRIVPDNLKAAVLVAALYDPLLGEAYRRLAHHYGCVISPTRPATPQHKGKVENGVHFVTRSFLAGQQFADIRIANAALGRWVAERAGTRDHGTTHQPPLALFTNQERDQLLPLPAEPFDLTETRRVKVHPDCHVVIDGSYYSVPFQHVGSQLDAYVFERVVQLFNGTDLLTSHPRASAKGTWATRLEHYPAHKAAYLERTPAYCREQARAIGPAIGQVVDQLLGDRWQDRLRSVQAILRLADSVGRERLEAACLRALFYGDPRYRRIKDILNAALDREPLPDNGPAQSAAARSADHFTFERAASEFFGAEAS